MHIFLLIILGVLLRLINIDKPEGLWNDEYVSWFVANKPLFDGFWSGILKQCHMPLYYIYLKPFSGFSDLILRLTSVLPSIIAIPVMYLTGKEFSKKTGLISASICATLPFLVYYAQEVRFYSLLFLFSALSLLFLIRYIKRGSGLTGYIISSVLILLTHVLGGIYVVLTLSYILYKKKQKKLALLFITLLPIIPFGVNILKMSPSSQWWGVFSYTNILFLFSDFFSPILTNNVNAPHVFFYNTNPEFIFLILFPTILGVLAIFLGAKKEKELAIIAVLNIIIMSLLALSGLIVFITKYSIEILPILILLASIGFSTQKAILALFIGINLFSIFTPYYPAKIFRSEGHKLVCDVLNKTNPDKIIYTYYDSDRFQRYLKIDAKSYAISKNNRFAPPQKLLDNVNTGEKVSVVILESVSFLPENTEINAPEMFKTFSNIKHILIKELDRNFKDFKVEKAGSWTVINAIKK